MKEPDFIGLITRLDLSRIIEMREFDPKILIEKRYSKGSMETHFTVHNHIHKKSTNELALANATDQANGRSSMKKTNSFYKEFLKDLAIEEPPEY